MSEKQIDKDLGRWTIAVDRTRHTSNGDRLIAPSRRLKRPVGRLEQKWYEDHPDAWELVEVVPLSLANELATALKRRYTGGVEDADAARALTSFEQAGMTTREES